MDANKQLDKVRGCLVGGAVGDALGYPVEFSGSYESICNIYGQKGITRYSTNAGLYNQHKAYISDDTQMTLFTACGLLNAKAKGMNPVCAVSDAYCEWYYTQMGMRSNHLRDCWVGDLPEMNVQRCPGITCMEALKKILVRRQPQNDSKGCGGVMRVAPVALYNLSKGRTADRVGSFNVLAADVAKLTHLHPLGYIPAYILCHLLYRLATDDAPVRESFLRYLHEAMSMARASFTGKDNVLGLDFSEMLDYQQTLLDKAVHLAGLDGADHVLVEQLGGGWVAEETLAIAVYCAYKYLDDFERAVVAAVNHSGDSDSTGAVTGNIVGAAVGYSGIPDHYKQDLELHDVILHVADDLWRGENTPFHKQ